MHPSAAMRFLLAALPLIATVVACSRGNLDGRTAGSGGDGTGGGGGAAGSCVASGAAGFGALSAGAAGSGGALVPGLGGTSGTPSDTICPDSIGSASGSGTLYRADGVPLMSMTAPVQVTAIESYPLQPLTQVMLVADTLAGAPRLIWSLAIGGLPDARFNVGDRFDLHVTEVPCALPEVPTPPPCQTVVLTRCGSLIAFTHQNYDRPPSPPSLAPWGIAVADGGAICRRANTSTPPSCQYQEHAARITMAQETLELLPGQSGSIADISFTIADYGSPGCDGSGYLTMSGFRAP
jgi:hypothetical protein